MRKLHIPALHRRAFTLIELLITTTLFAIVSVLTVYVLVNGMTSARRIQADIFLDSEGKAVMDQLTREIEQNTIDYEAYYLRNVQGETGWETQNYGYYGQSFYNPGDDGWYGGPYSSLADYYGVSCTGVSGTYPADCPTETPNYDDLDFDTGTHPFTGIGAPYTDDETSMNAFCEDDATDCNDLEYGMTNELILINSDGDERTVIVRELFDSTGTEYRLSKAKLTGSDTDGDGISDAWVCKSNYVCTGSSSTVSGGTVPHEDDPVNDDEPQEDFMPMTPEGLNITEFSIYLAPLEDSYRAFAEDDVQTLLQVTVLMTVTLSKDYGANFLGETPTVTLQRSFSTNVYGEIISYE